MTLLFLLILMVQIYIKILKWQIKKGFFFEIFFSEDDGKVLIAG
jgi:hypothetical protein